MQAVAVPVEQASHLKALPIGSRQERGSAQPSPPNLKVMEPKQEPFRLEIESVGTGDPPSLMLWGEE
jgi:hypothetical protein